MVKTLGEKIKRARKIKFLDQAAVAVASGYSTSTVQKVEGDKPGPSPQAIAAIAKVVGVEVDAAALIDGDPPLSPLRHLPPMPIYRSAVAAGGWQDACIGGEFDADNPEHQAVIRFGRFIIILNGDSMEPDWRDGEHVIFRVLRVDEESMKVGGDYYVCRSDNRATFKRLVAVNDDAYTFRGANRKHKVDMIVSRQEVVRVAEAEAIWTPPRRKVN